MSQVTDTLTRDVNEPLNFIHVAKCGGTSVRMIIDNLFDKADIYPYYFWHQVYTRGHVDPYKYKLVRGHLGLEPWRPGFIPSNIFVWMRDPCDRLLSNFYYQKRLKTPDVAGVDTVSEWVERLRKKHHFPTLIGGLLFGGVNGSARARKADSPREIRLRIGRGDESLITEAKKVLDGCFMVGLQERFDESVNLLCYKLGTLPPKAVPRENVKPASYVDYYDSETENLIKNIFLKDIETFHYHFGD